MTDGTRRMIAVAYDETVAAARAEVDTLGLTVH
jgi:hypothetical protein